MDKLLVIIGVVMARLCDCWSTDELALYDLVEEVNANFYELFSLEKDASLSDVKKAYRRLSMELHPDRNQAEDANEQFRRIAAIYDVLKSPSLRQAYDNILEFGLPDWRQPIYYLRRARKLSWIETTVVLLLISTITHYLMMWGAYIDKCWILESRSSKHRKKELQRQRKAGICDEMIDDQLLEDKPKLTKLLPFILISFAYHVVLHSPELITACYEYFFKQQQHPEEEEEPLRKVPIYMELSPQPVYEYAVASDLKPVMSTDIDKDGLNNHQLDSNSYSSRGKKWTCEDLEHLVKLTTEKYPAGTPDRWKLVGLIMNRDTDEVAAMTGKLKLVKKDEYSKLLRASQSSSVVLAAANVTSLKDKDKFYDDNDKCGGDTNTNDVISSPADEWSQHDQRLFETALQQFPKGTADRYDFCYICSRLF
ncbi:unnamed protein product [Anisakis simplex]|uniref:DnaJ homolog subfamily C member 1 (inferred by orthology to a human protein) n=1 Tax=Anisakis simplex TaxID=6269 RepID=A0A0M3K4I2_ANISI|nr:unnamed protein product [Anisakis simplex]